MVSHRLQRTARTATATAALLTVTFTPTVATAQPNDPPSSSSEALERYQELGAQAAQANEDLLVAERDLAGKQEELARVKDALARAKAVEQEAEAIQDRFRGRVDQLAKASYQGARLNGLSALLVSESPNNFLDRMSALEVLAADKQQALDQYGQAVTQARDARHAAEQAKKQAQEAADAAARLVDEIRQRKEALGDDIEQVRQALNRLSAQQRESLSTVQDTGSYSGPPGAANAALQAALSKRGSEYEWGAEGPTEFDCSGLTSWAYEQAGIDIPRTSRTQYQAGKPVSRSELQPGDLLFYDDGSGDPSQIHHVGMYVGNGKMVDAPTEGQLVDVRSMEGDGHYIGARRYVG